MKNKKATYFLGLLVLSVWGVILYRVFATLNGNDDFVVLPVNSGINKQPYNDYNLIDDTTHLLLNYKDPFAIKKVRDTPDIPIKTSVPSKTIQPLIKPVNWNFIKYSGYIRNPGTKNLVAVVNINGKSVMMAEGDTEEQVKLVKNLQDSIQVNFNGKTAYIKIRPASL